MHNRNELLFMGDFWSLKPFQSCYSLKRETFLCSLLAWLSFMIPVQIRKKISYKTAK